MRFLCPVAAGVLAMAAAAPVPLLAQPKRPAASKAVVSADGIVMQGPVLGYVYDADRRQLHPITGVAGAASVDAPLGSFGDTDNLAVAPGGEYGIGRRAGDETLMLLRWKDGVLAAQALPDAAALPDLVVFSPSGASAALLSTDTHKVQVWTGLPEAPAMAREVNVPLATVASLAVSDDGSAVAAGLASEVPALQLLGESGRTLASGGAYPALQFSRGTRDLLYTDANSKQLVALADVTDSATASMLASDADGISDPVGMGVSADGNRVVVVNRESQRLTITDVAARKTVTLAYDTTPQEVTRLSGNALFRLNSSVKKGIALLDASGDEPRLLYIPTPGNDNQ